MTRKDKILCLVFIVVALTSITLYPCLNNDFVNLDDGSYVRSNPYIRSISWDNAKTVFSTFYFGNYTPLTLLSYAFDYRFGGPKPRVYHATNLVLHLLNCILVFSFIYLISGKEYIAFIVSLFFGIHPLHVESVAWISERKDVLYSLFFLSSLISYVIYCRTKKGLHYALTLCLFILSCLSKPMAVTLPLVLLLIDYLTHQTVDKKWLLLKIPFIAIAAVFSYIAVLTQCVPEDLKSPRLFSVLTNVCLASYDLLFYLAKTAFPVHLSVLYPIPPGLYDKLPIVFKAAPFGVAILAFVTALLARRTRKVSFGTGFFVATLLPVLQLVPIGTVIAADRYTYVPAIGLFYCFAEGGYWLYTAKLKGARIPRMLTTSGIAVLIAVLCLLSWQRCHVWSDSIRFWTDVISKYPNSAMAYNSRGTSYYETRNFKEALIDYKRSLDADPYYNAALINLIGTYSQLGKNEEAISVYRTWSQKNPGLLQALLNLGRSYMNYGQVRAAISLYQELLIVLPQETLAQQDGRIYNDLAVAYYRSHRYESALYYAHKAAEAGYVIDPELRNFTKPQ